MSEQWIHWHPISFSKKRVTIESFEDKGSIQIVLRAADNINIIMLFKMGPRAYRKTVVRTSPPLDGQQFFKIHNSSYLKWLSDESSTISDYMLLQHFIITDNHLVLDIACRYDPMIE